MRLLWLLLALLISYGSLYPFNFEWQATTPQDWWLWLTAWEQRTTRGDILSNILLFIPYGFFGLLSVQPVDTHSRTFPLAWRVAWVVLSGLLLALGLQVLQFYLPSRVPTAGDAVWNLLGMALGVASALLLSSRRVQHRLPSALVWSYLSVPLVVAMLWLAYRLFPYIPAIDWQSIKDSIKPVFLISRWTAYNTLHDATAWLLFVWLLNHWFARHNFQLLLLCGGATLGLEVLIFHNSININNVVGLLLALLLTPLLNSDKRPAMLRAGLLLGAIVCLLSWRTLDTLDWAHHTRDFSLLPFSGFLKGSMWVNSHALVEKLFWYSAALYTCRYVLDSWRLSTALIASWLLILELLQTLLVNHHPEITDPLLAALQGLALAKLEQHVELRAAHPPRPVEMAAQQQ